jgi:hypothetical protein
MRIYHTWESRSPAIWHQDVGSGLIDWDDSILGIVDGRNAIASRCFSTGYPYYVILDAIRIACPHLVVEL